MHIQGHGNGTQVLTPAPESSQEPPSVLRAMVVACGWAAVLIDVPFHSTTTLERYLAAFADAKYDGYVNDANSAGCNQKIPYPYLSQSECGRLRHELESVINQTYGRLTRCHITIVSNASMLAWSYGAQCTPLPQRMWVAGINIDRRNHQSCELDDTQ